MTDLVIKLASSGVPRVPRAQVLIHKSMKEPIRNILEVLLQEVNVTYQVKAIKSSLAHCSFPVKTKFLLTTTLGDGLCFPETII